MYTREYQMSRIINRFILLLEQFGTFRVGTMHKKKANKVQLVNLGELNSSKPRRVRDQVEKSKETDIVQDKKGVYSNQLIPKFLDIQRGSRLTIEHTTKLIIRKELTLEERVVFIEMLYNKEKALVFNFLYCRKVCLEVALLQVIKTIKHKAWQVLGFLVPKALVPIVVEILQERLQSRRLEYYNSLY